MGWMVTKRGAAAVEAGEFGAHDPDSQIVAVLRAVARANGADAATVRETCGIKAKSTTLKNSVAWYLTKLRGEGLIVRRPAKKASAR